MYLAKSSSSSSLKSADGDLRMIEHTSLFPDQLFDRYKFPAYVSLKVSFFSKKVSYWYIYEKALKEKYDKDLAEEDLDDEIGKGAEKFVEGLVTLVENLLMRMYEYSHVNDDDVQEEIKQEIEKEVAKVCTIFNHTYAFEALDDSNLNFDDQQESKQVYNSNYPIIAEKLLEIFNKSNLSFEHSADALKTFCLDGKLNYVKFMTFVTKRFKGLERNRFDRDSNPVKRLCRSFDTTQKT